MIGFRLDSGGGAFLIEPFGGNEQTVIINFSKIIGIESFAQFALSALINIIRREVPLISRDLAATVNALCAGINLSILTVFVNDTEDVHEAVEVNLFLLLTFTQLHIERVPADAVIECVVGVRLFEGMNRFPETVEFMALQSIVNGDRLDVRWEIA